MTSPLRVILFLFFLLFGTPSIAQQGEPSIPFELPPTADILRLKSAIIYTTQGEVQVKLFPEVAPWHVANLKYLADKGFFRGLPLTIPEPRTYLQVGRIPGAVATIPGYTLPAEFSSELYNPGSLVAVMRRIEANPERRSDSTQFRLVLQRNIRADGKFTVFGRIAHGFEILERLGPKDVIEDLKVFVRKSG